MTDTIFWTSVGLLHVVLAALPAWRARSWKRFLIALVLSFLGIGLPLVVFSFSVFMVPDWKGQCHHGWLDCFHRGKLALAPLVLWACAALYAVEIWRTPGRTRPWIVLGLLTGAAVSAVCFGVGVRIVPGSQWKELAGWMGVPFYVAVWYGLRARQLLKAAGTSLGAMAATLLGTVPFWIGAIVWSRRAYAALPDTPPNCFVATAAARGHACVVGPRIRVSHHGRTQEATRQLRTLWAFEERWARRAPRSHAAFRRVYNIAGPLVAARITTPFAADLAHLAIKPLELAARAVLKRG